MSARLLSTGASLRPKKGLQGWQNKARQGYENHGRCRPPRSVAVHVESATPHEVKLALPTLVGMVVPEAPQNLVGDNAYDSDQLDAELNTFGIELISPHRSNRKNKTQDLRRLRRYRRRWKIERLFAWLQNFRRLVVRYERYAENFLGMLHLGCCIILLRHL
jgi:transposase